MNQTQEEIMNDFALLSEDNYASIDPSVFYSGEHHRLPMDAEAKSGSVTPLFPMFPTLVRELERDDVTGVLINGYGQYFELYSNVQSADSEVSSIDIFEAAQIAETKPVPGMQVKRPLPLYFKTYYLLRYYLLGGSKKYAVTKLDEGFVVFVNDPENPHVWAKHKVI
jgi:hypothetical protein